MKTATDILGQRSAEIDLEASTSMRESTTTTKLCRKESVLLLVLMVRYTISRTEVQIDSIAREQRAGCVAQVSTNQGLKWIYLLDDLKLIGDQQ